MAQQVYPIYRTKHISAFIFFVFISLFGFIFTQQHFATSAIIAPQPANPNHGVMLLLATDTATVTPTATASPTDTPSATPTPTASPTATATPIPGDLVVTISSSKPSPETGDYVTYTIAISNIGQVPLSQVLISMHVPSEVTILRADYLATNPLQRDLEVTTRAVTFTANSLAANEQIHIIVPSFIKVGLPNVSLINIYTGGRATGESNTSNNYVTLPVTIINPKPYADALVETLVSPGPYQAGEVVTYTIYISNVGGFALQGLAVTDTLASDSRVLSVRLEGAGDFNTDLKSRLSGFTLTVTQLDVGGRIRLTMSTRIGAATSPGTNILNEIKLSGDNDRYSINNSSLSSISVLHAGQTSTPTPSLTQTPTPSGSGSKTKRTYLPLLRFAVKTNS